MLMPLSADTVVRRRLDFSHTLSRNTQYSHVRSFIRPVPFRPTCRQRRQIQFNYGDKRVRCFDSTEIFGLKYNFGNFGAQSFE